MMHLLNAGSTYRQTDRHWHYKSSLLNCEGETAGHKKLQENILAKYCTWGNIHDTFISKIFSTSSEFETWHLRKPKVA